jgi:serine/threonine protein kinase
MLVSHDEDSRVKLIDFGMMVSIPPETGVYKSKGVQGTRGFVAPESLKNSEYSAKSDFWQAGCTLYALLSGLPAFSPHRLEQTIAAEYFKMVGVGWDNVSESARELVASILTKDPNDRPTAEQMLSHPWISGGAPDTDMGEAYYKRIKSLALKHKMKTFFQDHETLMANKLRKAKLRAVLPFLRPGSRARRSSEVISINRRVSADSFKLPSAVNSIQLRKRSNSMDLGDLPPIVESCGASFLEQAVQDEVTVVSVASGSAKDCTGEGEDDLQENLDKLSSLVVSSMARMSVGSVDDKDFNSPAKSASADDQLNSIANGHIDYDTFVAAMIDCELPELACPCVFNIFDIDKTGTVDLKDFLLTMVAFRDTAAEMEEENEEAQITPEKRRNSIAVGNSPRRSSVSSAVPMDDPESKDENKDNDSDSIVRFYFNMFDVGHTGYIDPEELKLAVSCLFADEQQKLAATGQLNSSSPHFQVSVPDIQALFEAIDTGKTGTIDYEEFKAFYNAVLINSTTRNEKSDMIFRSQTSGTVGSGTRSKDQIIMP